MIQTEVSVTIQVALILERVAGVATVPRHSQSIKLLIYYW